MNNWEVTYRKMCWKTACWALLFTAVAVGIFWLVWMEGALGRPTRLPLDALMGVTGFFALVKIFELLYLLKTRGKYIYQLGNGLAFSEGKDVKMFEEMSKNGYSLQNVNVFGFYKFEQSEPKELSYSIDYHSIEKGKENLEEYIEIFENSGWEYVCGDCTIHYFRAPKGTVAIYTDQTNLSDKYNLMKKISVMFVGVGGAVAVLFLGLALILNNSLPLGLFLFFAVVGLASLGLSLAMGVGALLNYLKAKGLRGRQGV